MIEADISIVTEGLWQVDGELNLDTVPDLLVKARRLDSGQSDVIVDLSRVTRANSAGLVLLLEWLDEGRRRRRKLRFRHIPDSIRNIARVSNVMDLLPEAPPEQETRAAPAPKKKVGVRRKRRKPRRWR